MDNTQIQKVKEHLISGKSITNTIAYELYGVQRLSAIIHVLRNKGMNIHTVMCEGKTRYGHLTKYGVYSIPRDSRGEDYDR